MANDIVTKNQFRITTPAHGVLEYLEKLFDVLIASANPAVRTQDVNLWFSGGSRWSFDESALDVNTSGKVDLRLQGSGSGNAVQWDASVNTLYASGKADVRLNGSAAGADVFWDASANLLQLLTNSSNFQPYLSATAPTARIGPGGIKLVTSGTDVRLYVNTTGTTFKRTLIST